MESQYQLANHYLDSENTEEDYPKLAVLLFKLVKDKTSIRYRSSCGILGGCYVCGYGVPVDEHLGLKWYAESLCNLNLSDGEERRAFDPSITQKVFELACKHNHRPLMITLLEHNNLDLYFLDDILLRTWS